MKRYHIGLAITLSLLVVVGGVYATWRYAQEAPEQVTQEYEIALAAKAESGKKGTITVTGTINFILDQKDDEHNAKIVLSEGSGDLTVTFTPDEAHAMPSEVENGIKMQYTLTGPSNLKYNDADVFTVTGTAQQINGGTACKTATITTAEILALITNVNLQLPTESNYDTYLANIPAGQVFTLTVSEVPAP